MKALFLGLPFSCLVYTEQIFGKVKFLPKTAQQIACESGTCNQFYIEASEFLGY